MSSWDNCRRKVRCKTIYHALIACWRMRRKNPFADIVAYSCKYCGGWHIGNQFNKRDARKSLNKLARMMAHPNFYIKAPESIQKDMAEKKQKMEGFLALDKNREV